MAGDNDDMNHKSKSEQKTGPDTAVHVDAAVVVNLQPFWQNNPRTWFQLAEIQFDAAKTNAINRYMKTLAALPHEICDRIPDIIANPPVENHYENLRDRLIERLAPSEERQLEALLAGEELGDRKPSEALIRIQTLAGNNFSPSIVRSLWIRKMPPLIKLALVGQSDSTNIAESAKTADKMFEILPTNHAIHEMSKRPLRRISPHTYRSNHDGNRRSPVLTVEDRLARIETRLDRMYHTRNSRSRERRFPSRNRSKSNSRSRERLQSRKPTNGVCWYHVQYGAQAKKCRSPCKFGQSTSAAAMDIEYPKNM